MAIIFITAYLKEQRDKAQETHSKDGQGILMYTSMAAVTDFW